MSTRHRLPTLSAAVFAALLITGCGSSGGGSGGKDLGALAGVNAVSSPTQRQARRSAAKAAQVNTSQLRYLDRLAERRTARGLPLPASLRVAQRRGKYSDEKDVVTTTKKLVNVLTNPITRLIPFTNRGGSTLTNSQTSSADSAKSVSAFKP